MRGLCRKFLAVSARGQKGPSVVVFFFAAVDFFSADGKWNDFFSGKVFNVKAASPQVCDPKNPTRGQTRCLLKHRVNSWRCSRSHDGDTTFVFWHVQPRGCGRAQPGPGAVPLTCCSWRGKTTLYYFDLSSKDVENLWILSSIFATKGEGDSAWCSCPSQLSWRRPSWCHQPHQLQPRVFRQRPGEPRSVHLSDPGGDAGMGSIHTHTHASKVFLKMDIMVFTLTFFFLCDFGLQSLVFGP